MCSLPRRQLRVDVAVGDEDVLPAVVVEVEEVDAEADILAVDAETGLDARVDEARAVVAVQRGHLFGEVGPDDVEPAVAVVVADADAHARRARRRARRTRSRRAPRSRGTCRRDCCDRAGWARCRRRRRCPASRRCRSRPPPRPSRTTRSAASSRRRRPWRTVRAAARSRTIPTRRRRSRRRGCDRGRLVPPAKPSGPHGTGMSL